MVKRKAIYFGRCSTEEQASGDSHNRQRNGARGWCGTHPDLDLDEKLSIFDEGHSAFSGLSPGLRVLMSEALAGTPRAAVIIVEDLDRLSRQGIDATNDILRTLVSIAGFEVHITSTSQILKPGFNNDLKDFMLNGVRSYLAHEESQKKSDRIRSVKDNDLKQAAIDGLALSSRAPGWIHAEKGKRPVLIDERVKAVKRVVELSGKMGLGCYKIIKTMTKESWPAFGKAGWTTNQIQRILRGREVLGEYKTATGFTIPNFYPPAISQSEWDLVQEVMNAKKGNHGNSPYKRGGSHGGGRSSDHNIFGTLLRDMTPPVESPNGRTMNYSGVKYNRPFFSSWHPTAGTNAIYYNPFQQAFLGFLKDLDWQSLVQESESSEVQEIRASLEILAKKRDRVKKLIAQREALYNDPDLNPQEFKIAFRNLNEAVAERGKIEAEQAVLNSAIASELMKAEVFLNEEEFKNLIKDESNGVEVRLRLKAAIRRRIKRIDLKFFKDPELGKIVGAKVIFVNGVERGIMIYASKLKARLYEEEKGTNRASTIKLDKDYGWRRRKKVTDEIARRVHRLFLNDKKTRLEIVAITNLGRDSVEDIVIGKILPNIYMEFHDSPPTCAPKRSQSKYRKGEPLFPLSSNHSPSGTEFSCR